VETDACPWFLFFSVFGIVLSHNVFGTGFGGWVWFGRMFGVGADFPAGHRILGLVVRSGWPSNNVLSGLRPEAGFLFFGSDRKVESGFKHCLLGVPAFWFCPKKRGLPESRVCGETLFQGSPDLLGFAGKPESRVRREIRFGGLPDFLESVRQPESWSGWKHCLLDDLTFWNLSHNRKVGGASKHCSPGCRTFRSRLASRKVGWAGNIVDYRYQPSGRTRNAW